MKRNVVVSKRERGVDELHNVMNKNVEMESIESYISDTIKKANVKGWKVESVSIMFSRDCDHDYYHHHELTFITVNQWAD